MKSRREELLELLLAQGRLSVDEISAHFGVTGMTVRRDLEAMEKEGLLTRTHGGCVLRAAEVRELPYVEKERHNPELKEAIARKLVSYVPDGASIYLDTGTTCGMVARLLRTHRRNLRVFTNNLMAALELFGTESIEVIVLGGVLGRSSPDLTGEYGLARIGELRFDLAIVGGDAIDPAVGEFYAADLATAALSQASQLRADKTFAVIDSSKFEKRALAVSGRCRSDVTIFTDASISRAAKRNLRKFGMEIVTIGNRKGFGRQRKS